MKKGDKVYCIKNRSPYLKGNIYYIVYIDSYEIALSHDNDKFLPYTFFILSKNLQHNFYSFYTFFITLKQSRKDKLKKINESYL